jgi:1A family penicillin-binding protein
VAAGEGTGAPGPRVPQHLRWWRRVHVFSARLVACGAGALVLAVVFLPVHPRANRVPTLIYADNGRLVAALSPGERVPVSYDEIPYDVRAATLAAEDATFYRNFGIDPAAILRAAFIDLRAGAVVQGGSTITQQLAKNLYLSDARTFRRKALELLYTLRLQATHSKTQILTSYLNTIYYGEGAYGIGAAAEIYFDEPLSRIDLAQAALLAGLPAAPQLFDPYLHPAAARRRQLWVLQRMASLGFVSAARAAAAAAEPLRYQRGHVTAPGPPAAYFVQYVLASIGQHDPGLEAAVRAGGYRVYTTLDPTMQEAADRAFASYMPPGAPNALGVIEPEGALVAIDPRNGAVRALIGGRSYRQSPFNRALYAMRQPGSTFKAFLYATVVGRGYPVTDRLFDGPVSYPGAGGKPYVVHDWDGYSRRWVTVREAVADSVNVVAVKWAKIVGPAAVIATARRMGLTTPMQPTLPLVLGAYSTTPLELADAYLPLANGGWAMAPWCVERVVSPAGETVWAPPSPTPRRALDPGVAYIVTSLLQSVMTDGTGRHLLPIVGRPVAGKTGTTNGLKDAWFVGYTPTLVADVWVGDDTPADLGGYGDTIAGPVWAHFMANALAGTPVRTFPMPADVRIVRVSAVDGLLPNPTSPTVPEVFLAGTVPTRRSPLIGYAGRDPGLTGIPGSQITPPPASATGPAASASAAAPSASGSAGSATSGAASGANTPSSAGDAAGIPAATSRAAANAAPGSAAASLPSSSASAGKSASGDGGRPAGSASRSSNGAPAPAKAGASAAGPANTANR